MNNASSPLLAPLISLALPLAGSAAPAPAAVPYGDLRESSEIHETVKRIEETVAKAADEPISDIRPDFTPVASADDEFPTRAFQVVTDPDDDLEKTAQFSFDGFEK